MVRVLIYDVEKSVKGIVITVNDKGVYKDEIRCNILVVEDEVRMREFIVSYLEKEGWNTLEASNGQEAIEIFSNQQVDLVILDIMMPKIDGKETCKRIREISEVHIIMLTALEEETSQLECYKIGADDYITKPFKAKVLVAKINRLLERVKVSVEKDDYEYKQLKVDYLAREVYLLGKAIKFAPKEYDLLTYLIKNKSIVKSREQILDEIWGYDYYGSTRVVDNHVLKVRGKLQSMGNNIITVVNTGYKYEEV